VLVALGVKLVWKPGGHVPESTVSFPSLAKKKVKLETTGSVEGMVSA
jgi:hypothetical protein